MKIRQIKNANPDNISNGVSTNDTPTNIFKPKAQVAKARLVKKAISENDPRKYDGLLLYLMK